MQAREHIELPSYEVMIAHVAWTAEDAMQKLLQIEEYQDERRGGYMAVMDAKTGIIVVVFRVGIINPEKQEKYMQFVCEKARRLYTTHEENGAIVTSWQTRDPNANKWGGAVWSEHWIVSFSGLPELADEALSTCVALSLETQPMLEKEALRIAQITSNPSTTLLMQEVLL